MTAQQEPYTYEQKQRIARARERADRKQQLILRCSSQTKAAKAELVRRGKGHNTLTGI